MHWFLSVHKTAIVHDICMSVKTCLSQSTEKIQRWCSRGGVWEYLDLTWREITRWRMIECREKLHKFWFTKRHCDDQDKEDEMEVACSAPDRDIKVGKHEGKVHLRRAGSRRVGNINIHLKERGEEGGPDSLGSEYGWLMGCCEHGYELQSSVMCSCCGCSSLIFELCHILDGSVAFYCIWSRKFDVHRILIGSMKEYSTRRYYPIVPWSKVGGRGLHLSRSE